MKTIKYYTLDSDKLIKDLEDNEIIQCIGIGDRYDAEKFPGMFSNVLNADNTCNWEITDEDDDGYTCIYSLSNDFEIREMEHLLILSKHLGGDIRGNYEDERIYIVQDPHDSFYYLIHQNLILAELTDTEEIDD